MRKEYLKHLIKKCLEALGLLNGVNTEFCKDWEEFRISLKKGVGSTVDSSSCPYPLNMLNTIVKEYLIIKVASLFHKHKDGISLYDVLDKKDVDKMKSDDIVTDIIEIRNKLVAHNDYKYLNKYLEDLNYGLSPADMINSNLMKLLEQCQDLLTD